MLRLPVLCKPINEKLQIRTKSSSSYLRRSFIDYFVNRHDHKYVKSSSVVPLCDSTVPFVNSGMHQFKNVFLGLTDPPYTRAVNSQKCVRVGGKHNDLDVVGLDGHHHTFFEMLGNWSFGDYYKKEACQMAWDLLLGPYRLKPENLLVTYFEGDVVLGLPEDRECRDIWKQIGIQSSHLKGHGARDNFWEMGATGPCGPCTEIHYIHPDGSLTEIWNVVFIQFNREADGSVRALRKQHVDTGMGLERVATLLQGVRSNYDTDLFRPLITAIEKNSKGSPPYAGRYDTEAVVDQAYRRLSDHARMISVCLADGVYPSTSLNLKQIMRKSFKMCTDIFQNPNLLKLLYDEVNASLGETYPELSIREKDAKLIIDHEMESYAKLRANLAKKWKELARKYPEVESLIDLEMAGFALGYKEFKETMAKQKTTLIPGDLVFKLYDTHGFQEDVIDRIAKLNKLEIDRKGFWKLLNEHKSRHKTAFKEQTSKKGIMFDRAIESLIKNSITKTNDQPKYNYIYKDNKVNFEQLKTNLVAILNEDGEWLDFSEPCENKPYYLVTESTNFFCEEGGQIADTGTIVFNEDIKLKVDSVFKIRDFVFHKGYFSINKTCDIVYVKNNCKVALEIDSEKRLNTMRNHTAIHLLNLAIRRVLPNSVVCQIGSSVTDKGLCLNLSVYGEKISQEAILKAQELMRESIKCNSPVTTELCDSAQLNSLSDVLTVPGETYPERGLRVVSCHPPLPARELCCGTHVPSTGVIEEVCITLVRAAATHAPALSALTAARATQARELFCRAQKLAEVIEIANPDRTNNEVAMIKKELSELCGTGGAPYGEYAECLRLLDTLQKKAAGNHDVVLHALAKAEISEAVSGRRFGVQFVRCSYLMEEPAARAALASAPPAPALLLACAGGLVVAAAHVPQELVTAKFSASSWLNCILPIFSASILPTKSDKSHLTFAEMSATKVSLISCEQMVQDAIRVAEQFAQTHLKDCDRLTSETEQDRRHN